MTVVKRDAHWYAEAIAKAFTPAIETNPDFNWKSVTADPTDDEAWAEATKGYLIEIPMSERVNMQVWQSWVDTDGLRSFKGVTAAELAAVLADAE